MLFSPALAVVVWPRNGCNARPLFHKQIRAGIQNRRFDIWKFRTMHPEITISPGR
jgi:lipopolysaccharide/colanic/teichoic acid biosynthesis glycosyltransferase